MTQDFTEIVRLGKLENRVDTLTPAQRAAYKRDLELVGSQNCVLVLLSAKLLAGRPLEIELMIGNNPKEAVKTFARFCALADYLGGTAEEVSGSVRSIHWVAFPHPPARH
jgi:hypothetical protein